MSTIKEMEWEKGRYGEYSHPQNVALTNPTWRINSISPSSGNGTYNFSFTNDFLFPPDLLEVPDKESPGSLATEVGAIGAVAIFLVILLFRLFFVFFDFFQFCFVYLKILFFVEAMMGWKTLHQFPSVYDVCYISEHTKTKKSWATLHHLGRVHIGKFRVLWCYASLYFSYHTQAETT